MKYIIYLFATLIFALAAAPACAADVGTSPEVMVVAANNGVELDVTMEMLDEDADSSSAIINVIELPVQEMHQEQLRNQRRLREESSGFSVDQEQDSPDAVQGEMSEQIIEAQQEAEEAKHKVSDNMPKQGR